MSDEHPQNPLQSLFSDSSPGERKARGAQGQAGAADLSISGLFSSEEGGGQLGRDAAEPHDGPAARAGRRVSVLDIDEPEVEAARQAECGSRVEAAEDEHTASPNAARSGTTADEPISGGPRVGRQSASRDIPETRQRTFYLPAAEASASVGLWEEREAILTVVLAVATIGGGVLVALRLLDELRRPAGLARAALLLSGYLLVSGAFALRRIPSGWRITVLVGVSYAAALYMLLTHGVTGAGAWYLLAIPVLLFALLGERYGLASAAVDAALYLGFAAAHRLGWLATLRTDDAQDSLSGSLALGVAFLLVMAAVVFVHSLFGRAQQRTRRLLRQHDDVLRAVQAAGAERQQLLERANAALRRQLRHSELATEMGRLAAVGLSMDELVAQAVELLCQSIGADYVGLYLLDEDRAYGQLHAESGSLRLVGRDRDERIRVSDDVLLRQCVSSGRPQILLGVDGVQGLTGSERGTSFLHASTRSALALPLVARGSVFGALSVQSRAPTAFDNTDVASLRTMTDQLSSAISNARLSQESRDHLQELERLQQYYVREAWEQFLIEDRVSTYEYHRPEVKPLGEGPMPEVERVLTDPRLVALEEGEVSALLVPIVQREHVLGVLGLHRLHADQPWAADQIELLAAISEQMGLTIENARLFAEARSRAAQERRIRQVVARLRQSLDVEEVLAMAVQEVADALHLEDVTIRLTGNEVPIGE